VKPTAYAVGPIISRLRAGNSRTLAKDIAAIHRCSLFISGFRDVGQKEAQRLTRVAKTLSSSIFSELKQG
jgi:hypothetical protein